VAPLPVAAHFIDLRAPAERLTAAHILCESLYHANDRLWLRDENSDPSVYCDNEAEWHLVSS
jgi:hypothetical protein